MDVLNLEQMPRSTRYFWQGRLSRLYTLCVWAGWLKARRDNVIPTLDAIWGTSGFAAFVYQHKRTGELRVCAVSPGPGWDYFGTASPTGRESTENLLAGVNLTGMTVDRVLRLELSQRELYQILRLLPVAGKYQGPAWANPEKSTGVLSDAMSLRDLNRPIMTETDQMILRLASQVMDDKAIKTALKAMAKHRVIPRQSNENVGFQ